MNRGLYPDVLLVLDRGAKYQSGFVFALEPVEEILLGEVIDIFHDGLVSLQLRLNLVHEALLAKDTCRFHENLIKLQSVQG
jgi:hypothetical protein